MKCGRKTITILLLSGALSANAIPPPPPAPTKLREARMTVMVQLVEASNGRVSKLTKLCKVSGTIPVYADDGGATRSSSREISGCNMLWQGKNLSVSVREQWQLRTAPLRMRLQALA